MALRLQPKAYPSHTDPKIFSSSIHGEQNLRFAVSDNQEIFVALHNLDVSIWICCTLPRKLRRWSISDFVELPNSGGVRALELRIHDDGESETPSDGDRVAIHYYGRLAAKQGWRFDSSYDHKDGNGEPIPFEFVLGSGEVISGIESEVTSMKVGGIRRVVIPPSQGFFDRQRLFTTIFNPTRLANGEGSTFGTLGAQRETSSMSNSDCTNV